MKVSIVKAGLKVNNSEYKAFDKVLTGFDKVFDGFMTGFGF